MIIDENYTYKFQMNNFGMLNPGGTGANLNNTGLPDNIVKTRDLLYRNIFFKKNL